jgi:leucyl-tRNA synthetase
MYQSALKYCWFEMDSLRKQYQDMVGSMEAMHPDCVKRFIEVQSIILSPITPHYAEFLWRMVKELDYETTQLKTFGHVAKTLWPRVSAPFDKVLARKYEVLQSDMRSFRLAKEQVMAEKTKKNKEFTGKITGATVYVAKEYKPWQQVILAYLKTVELNDTKTGPKDPKGWSKGLRDSAEFKAFAKDEVKKAMPFAAYIINEEMSSRGVDALALELPFNEAGMLEERSNLIKRQLNVEDFKIAIADQAGANKDARDSSEKITMAQPAKPSIVFFFDTD